MPVMLHGAAAAADDDDDDGSGGGRLSKKAKKKAAQAATDSDDDDGDDGDDNDVVGGGGNSTAANSRGYSRRGRATSHATPGDFSDRVQSTGDVVTFTWPSRDAKPESVRSFDAAGVKADLADFGVENADEICVPFQFMYAMSTNFGDDDYRLAHAYRFCPCPHDHGHDSVAAAAHEQAEGLDRDLINSWEC